MLKIVIGFKLTDLLAIVAIIVILAILIAPNIIIGIQKSEQKNTMKDTTLVSTTIIKKIKASHRTFNKYIQGVMGVNKAEKELVESIEIFKKRHPDLWQRKPWEKNVSNFNNSGQLKKEAGI